MGRCKHWPLNRPGKVIDHNRAHKIQQKPRKRWKVGRAKRRRQYNKRIGFLEGCRITDIKSLEQFEQIINYLHQIFNT